MTLWFRFESGVSRTQLIDRDFMLTGEQQRCNGSASEQPLGCRRRDIAANHVATILGQVPSIRDARFRNAVLLSGRSLLDV